MMTDTHEPPDRPFVVVIAEDEKALRAIAVRILSDEGFTAIEAEHATAALNICESQAAEIDVLFTDVRMPGPMNGVELAHRVCEQWPWISVVITSGHLQVNRSELPKGTRFLAKPYRLQQVVDLFHELRQS